MVEKINIAELLKYCPSGMELDCTMYDNCTYEGIEDNGYIDILINTPSGQIRLAKEGCYIRHDDNAKCIIFPKGKTTWEGFVPPCNFKDGDIISDGNNVAIFYKLGTACHCASRNIVYYHCYYNQIYCQFRKGLDFGIGTSTEFNYATEEEKRKLFDAIKDNGYKWNAETKTLERLIEPKFKVGNRVKHISAYASGIVVKVNDKGYYIDYPKGEGVCFISFTLEKDYELAPNKFDISTLKPFENRVLVREEKTDVWKPAFYGFFNQHNKRFYTVSSGTWLMCIPYNEETKHLTGTTNDCDDFYKTWE